MRHFSILAGCFLLVLSSVAMAQNVPPALMVKQEKDRSTPLELTRLDVDVEVHGFLARTSMEMTFYNPNDRVLEGDLYFPLPEGATVSGYALDIEGKMVDGVAVEKTKGRVVFEKIVRQGIDPGLIEWTRGNNFKTRVFPIPAKGSRTIRVTYTSEIEGDAKNVVYRLPMQFKKPIAGFSIDLKVIQLKSKPRIVAGQIEGLEFTPWQKGFFAKAEKKDFQPKGDLVIELPRTGNPQVLVQKAEDGNTYFAIGYACPVTRDVAGKQVNLGSIALVWDASGSRAGDHEKELALLKGYLEQFPAVTVRLYVLRDKMTSHDHFNIAGNADKLIEHLKAVDYDGGTQLGALGTPFQDSPNRRKIKPRLCLVFSDGISNFGSSRVKPFGVRTEVFSGSSTADHAALRRLAQASGGQYFNLAATKDIKTIVPAIGLAQGPKYLGLTTSGGKITPAAVDPPTLPAIGHIVASGRLDSPEAMVSLSFMGPGSPDTLTFEVSKADALEGEQVRTLWAQQRLDSLVVDAEEHREQIIALGKEHGMVTPHTSLIVLDSLDQYVENEIAPPRSLPKMRAQYFDLVGKQEKQKQQDEKQRLQRVIEQWNQRVAWWKKEYKYPKDFKWRGGADKKGEGGDRDGGLELENGEDEAAPAEQPEPGAVPPPPATEAPRAVPEDAEGGRPFSDEDRNSNSTVEEKSKDGKDDESAPGITIKAWDPKTPYIAALKKAGKGKQAAVYMEQRKKYAESPAFYLDCADFFHKQGNQPMAVQVLSNLAELELENPQILRVLGYRLLQWDMYELAIATFEEVKRLRPEEPQSYRDLAIALDRQAAASDNPSLQKANYLRAGRLLYKVVSGQWDGRFNGIELMALEELNRLLVPAKKANVTIRDFELPVELVKVLDADLDVDVRVVMTWDADNTDIDLWVIEPSGEKAFYSHNRTTIGGLVSNDFTGGYGPEEYMVRRAMPGKYKIKAHYYGSGAVKLLGGVAVQVDVYTNFGRPNEQRQSFTFQLKTAEDVYDIGEVEFK